MFKLKAPENAYKTCFSEYFIEKYPLNYFNVGIDIGASGICHMWHINHMGLRNKKTKFVGFEPDTDFYNKIVDECKSLKNVVLYKQFFGTDVNFKQIFEQNDIDMNGKWYLSCDCEGDEKYLFNNSENLEILKKCAHFCFEFHVAESNISYENMVNILKEHFSESHKIIQSFKTTGYAVFILIKNDTYNDLTNNVKNVIENNRIKPEFCNPNVKNTTHRILYLN